MKIYLADAHRLLRDGLKMIIQSEFQGASILEASAHHELKNLIQENSPNDLLLYGFEIQGKESFAELQSIREAFPNIKLIILSGSYPRYDFETLLGVGVSGFVAKTVTGASLINIIRFVQAGEVYVPPEYLKAFTEITQGRGKQKVVLNKLTTREKQVLKQLGKGYSNKKISREFHIEESTIKSHVKNIFDKLGVVNRTQAASFVYHL